MKKIFTLLSIAALTTSFAQVQKINSVEKLETKVNNVELTNKVDETTYSQLSSDDLSPEISVLSCQDLQAPVQISRGYDMKADYGINVPFTVTKINVAGKPYKDGVVEGMIVKYNGEWSDYMLLSNSEMTDAYGALVFTSAEDAAWYDIELDDPYKIPVGQKFLTSIVAYIGKFTTNPNGSFIPWVNNEGTTETRPSWFGGEAGLCGIDENGNYVNISSVPDFADTGVYLLKVTGNAEGLGTVELGSTNLAVYPNPATTEVNVKLEGSKVADVTVADVTGRVIPVSFSKDGKVDTSRLAAGVYFLRVKDDKGVTRIQKIIKK